MNHWNIQVADETEMTQEEDRAIRDLLCACFPADRSVFATTRAWHGSVPTYSLLAQQDGQPCGHVGCVVRTIRVDMCPVCVLGIQNLAVVPECRGSGLGAQLITAATNEASARGIPFGLLFCVPELERFYADLGWYTLRVRALMDYLGETDSPIPGKNIAMAKDLAGLPFPRGDIHLCGADW
ncbi:MAG: GNAT family N-acetyltransferase [bacterium]|jgi:predicted N-acetyltransferase YhbS